MVNNLMMVGRITEMLENGIKIGVARNYKNDEGEYETDFFTVVFSDKVLKDTKEYCRKGDVVGVKGRLENIKDEKDITKEVNVVVGEKISFLSSKKEN